MIKLSTSISLAELREIADSLDYQDEISKKLLQASAINTTLRHEEAFSRLSDEVVTNTLCGPIGDLVADAERLLRESWEVKGESG